MILDFLNTNRRIFFVVACLMMLFVLPGCVDKKKITKSDAKLFFKVEDILEQTDDYSIYAIQDNKYGYEIYTINGDVAYRDILYRIPQITIYDEQYIEVKWGAGTGLWNCVYYDKQACFISADFECARYIGKGNVVLVEEGDKRQIKVFNPFSYNEYSQRLEIDLYQSTANPADCLLKAEYQNDGKLHIVYLDDNGEEKEAFVDCDM